MRSVFELTALHLYLKFSIETHLAILICILKVNIDIAYFCLNTEHSCLDSFNSLSAALADN